MAEVYRLLKARGVEFECHGRPTSGGHHVASVQGPTYLGLRSQVQESFAG